MPHNHKKLVRIGHGPAATISTLAAKTAITGSDKTPTQNFAPALYQGVFSAKGGAADEPIAVYIADGDLTQAEVEAAIEAAPLHNRDTLGEQTDRAVQLLGMISSERPLHLELGNRLPMFRENIGWEIWFYNPSFAAMTTGMIASGQMWVYGRWKD